MGQTAAKGNGYPQDKPDGGPNKEDIDKEIIRPLRYMLEQIRRWFSRYSQYVPWQTEFKPQLVDFAVKA